VPEVFETIRGTAELIVPEIILLATVCALFLLGPLFVTDSGDAPVGVRGRWGQLSLLAIAAAWGAWYHAGHEAAVGSMFSIDGLVWYVRGLSFPVGFLIALVMWNQIDDGFAAEAYACLLSMLVGVNLVAAANNLVSLFLALELVSIPTYILLYLSRRDRIGGEATLKYFLLSIFSSAVVLYGMSWLYGVTGSTSFAAIHEVIVSHSSQMTGGMLEIAFALLVAGLSFRIAAVPFHFYAPDVFQGTTGANAAMLSVIPKIVGFTALMRVLPLTGQTNGATNWVPSERAAMLLTSLAVLTMIVGNLMALRQRQLFRLLAYSSIAHAGYMLIGLTVGHVSPVDGCKALLFYLAIYAFMTIGVFAILGALSSSQRPLSSIDDLRGFSRSQPLSALLLAVCLFSLTGIPPTAGFLGKLNLFMAAWSAGPHPGHYLAIWLALNAAISAFYYLRIVAYMFLEPAGTADDKPVFVSWASWLAGAACALVTIVIFFSPQCLWDAIH
jgi:NADH-quinone oxidoreductase subunit N